MQLGQGPSIAKSKTISGEYCSNYPKKKKKHVMITNQL